MAARNVLLSRAAAKTLARVDATTRKRLTEKIVAIADDPTNEGEPLKGSTDQWRARVGGWRIVYRFDQTSLWVDVIAPRGQVYRSL